MPAVLLPAYDRCLRRDYLARLPSEGGVGPDTYFCGVQGHEFAITISALCIGHRAMHELFDDPNAANNFTYPESLQPWARRAIGSW